MKCYKIFKSDVYYSNDRCVPLFHLLEDCITNAFETNPRIHYRDFYLNSYMDICFVLLQNKFINVESYIFLIDYLIRCTCLNSYILHHAIDVPRVCYCCGVVVTELSDPSACLYHISDDLLYSADDNLIDSDIRLYEWLNTLPTYLPFH